MKQLHIVMYSELKPYGGGRETWLQYFLNGVKDKYKKINIYGIKLPADEEANIIDALDFDVNAFYVDRISVRKFVTFATNALQKNFQEGDTCLMIGAVVEGMIAPWLKFRYGKKIKRIIWVRSIGAYEVANRHNPKLYPLVQMLETFNLNAADKVITNGNDTYAYYKDYWKTAKGRLHVVTNAVELEKYQFQKTWKLEQRLKCVFLGRLEPIKGVDILLDAIALFNEKNPKLADKIEFDFWGEGSLKDSICATNVNFNGRAGREAVPGILRDAQVEFFIADLNEKGIGGLSHSLLEGMAAECLCICTGIPAYKQVISDSNGIIIENQTVESLAQVIETVALSYTEGTFELFVDKAKQVRKDVENHSVERHVEKFLKITDDVNA